MCLPCLFSDFFLPFFYICIVTAGFHYVWFLSTMLITSLLLSIQQYLCHFQHFKISRYFVCSKRRVCSGSCSVIGCEALDTFFCADGLLLFTASCVELELSLESLLDHKDLPSHSFLKFIHLANSSLRSASALTSVHFPTNNIFIVDFILSAAGVQKQLR